MRMNEGEAWQGSEAWQDFLETPAGLESGFFVCLLDILVSPG
jgi:hypothetical protein